MIFDSWGGVLAHDAYREFSLAYIRQVVAGLTREKDGEKIPVHRVHQGRRPVAGRYRRQRCRRRGPRLDRGHRRCTAPGGRQGCPAGQPGSVRAVRYPEAVAAEARKVLDAYGPHAGHVFNLGHGISQFTPPDNVTVLVDTVHEHSRPARPGTLRH
jgi:uroporphyrinogen decarboxylase